MAQSLRKYTPTAQARMRENPPQNGLNTHPFVQDTRNDRAGYVHCLF